jgi:hypothetical protein
VHRLQLWTEKMFEMLFVKAGNYKLPPPPSAFSLGHTKEMESTGSQDLIFLRTLRQGNAGSADYQNHKSNK